MTNPKQPIFQAFNKQDFLEYVANGQTYAVKSLVENGVDVRNTTDEDGRNAFHLATQIEIVTYLLGIIESEQTSILEAADNNGNTPLLLSIHKGIDIFKSFAKAGSNINAKNNRGFTALHSAVEYGHYDIVQYILGAETKGVELDVEDSIGGNTPLHYAALFRQTEAVALLVKSGAQADRMNDAFMTPRDKTNDEGIRKMLGK